MTGLINDGELCFDMTNIDFFYLQTKKKIDYNIISTVSSPSAKKKRKLNKTSSTMRTRP